jgi:hypothetical protein
MATRPPHSAQAHGSGGNNKSGDRVRRENAELESPHGAIQRNRVCLAFPFEKALQTPFNSNSFQFNSSQNAIEILGSASIYQLSLRTAQKVGSDC